MSRPRRAVRLAALLCPALLVPLSARAHGVFGVEHPWLIGALTPLVFPQSAAACLALAALAARQPGAGGRRAVWAGIAGLLTGAMALLWLRLGFPPDGPAAPAAMLGAGLLALAPRLPVAAAALAALAAGAAPGLSLDLHAPIEFAALQTLGACVTLALLILAGHALLRALPERPRALAAAILGAWCAAAALMIFAFRLASP